MTNPATFASAIPPVTMAAPAVWVERELVGPVRVVYPVL